MREFNVGDVVTDVILGKTGKVVDVEEQNVIVHFNDGTYRYSLDGKYGAFDKVPRLYHGEGITIEIKQPVYEYQVIFKGDSCNFFMTADVKYSSKEEFDSVYKGSLEFIELYQPSKRVRK